MTSFNVGDRVRVFGEARGELIGGRSDAHVFAGSIGTICEVLNDYVQIELDNWQGNQKSFWFCTGWEGIDLRKVGVVEEPSSPVREKVVKEIVPGVYGRIAVGSGDDQQARVGFDRSYLDTEKLKHGSVLYPLTASELREAAKVFEQLAEALEDE